MNDSEALRQRGTRFYGYKNLDVYLYAALITLSIISTSGMTSIWTLLALENKIEFLDKNLTEAKTQYMFTSAVTIAGLDFLQVVLGITLFVLHFWWGEKKRAEYSISFGILGLNLIFNFRNNL